ncbi:hypothetical protein NT6N_04450 [Oceaniferula spumae]|uniref:Uncharacterized protein n=1 Tax=Oceaniferula spumae TaxID=2979115 RepID=A0AAT9FHL6_9BACT
MNIFNKCNLWHAVFIFVCLNSKVVAAKKDSIASYVPKGYECLYKIEKISKSQVAIKLLHANSQNVPSSYEKDAKALSLNRPVGQYLLFVGRTGMKYNYKMYPLKAKRLKKWSVSEIVNFLRTYKKQSVLREGS